jgi:hypothetical protein
MYDLEFYSVIPPLMMFYAVLMSGLSMNCKNIKKIILYKGCKKTFTRKVALFLHSPES